MQQISTETKEGLLFVRLNRPDKRNAFHPEMIRELKQTFENIGNNSTLRAVHLSGEGKSFCAGADLEWMKSMAKFNYQENVEDSEQLFDMFAAIKSCPIPVVGQVHGHVMGGATGLVASCDIVAAEVETVFCFSEVRLGIVPAVISPFVMAKMHYSKAQQFMLTAKTFDAPEARDAGLIQYCGTKEQVQEFVEKTLESFQKTGPEAVRATKGLLAGPHGDKWRSQREGVAKVIAERRVSAEGQEGLAAFLEKRKPSWNLKQ